MRYAALGGDSAPRPRSGRAATVTATATGAAPATEAEAEAAAEEETAPEPVTNGADSPRVLTYDDWLSAPPNADTVEEVPVDPLGAAGVPGKGTAAAPPLRRAAVPGGARVADADCPVPASTVFSLLDLAGGAAPPLAAAGKAREEALCRWLASRQAGGAAAVDPAGQAQRLRVCAPRR